MTLEDRVLAYKCLELPGQPMSMHMGTANLINDLMEEVKRLRTVVVELTDKLNEL